MLRKPAWASILRRPDSQAAGIVSGAATSRKCVDIEEAPGRRAPHLAPIGGERVPVECGGVVPAAAQYGEGRIVDFSVVRHDELSPGEGFPLGEDCDPVKPVRERTGKVYPDPGKVRDTQEYDTTQKSRAG